MLKKLKILTFTQKTIEVEIDDSKTVYELKRSLYLNPDVTSPPEFQRIVSAGKILVNEDPLSHYNLDDGKPLVIMGLQEMEREMEARKAASDNEPVSATETPIIEKRLSAREKLAYIVEIGYAEEDAVCALLANFFKVELAIKSLAKGVPAIPSARAKSVEPSYTRATFGGVKSNRLEDLYMDHIRTDPHFRRVCRTLQEEPRYLGHAMNFCAQICPPMFCCLVANGRKSLEIIFSPSDDEDYSDDEEIS